MAWNKLTVSPLKGRKRMKCEHFELRKPVVIDMAIYQRCKRCDEYILRAPKRECVKVSDEHLSIINLVG